MAPWEEASGGGQCGPPGAAAGRGAHSPQGRGCEGRPRGAELFAVPLKNLLDELVHHLRQVLERAPRVRCPQGPHLHQTQLVTAAKGHWGPPQAIAFKHPVQGRSPVETSSLDSLKVHRLGYAASGRPPANQQTGALWGGGGEPAAKNGHWEGPAATPMSACSVSGACTPPQPSWSPPAGAVPSACARPSPTAVCWPGLWLGTRRYLWPPLRLPVPWLSSERGDTTQSRHVGAGWHWDRMTGTLYL